jgi:hypothetical protein
MRKRRYRICEIGPQDTGYLHFPHHLLQNSRGNLFKVNTGAARKNRQR